MTMSAGAQKALVWWAIAFMTLFGVALIFLLRMVPPPSASWTPAEVAAYYMANGSDMRLGATLAAWTSGFMVPLAVVISVQMARLEKGMPIWSILQLAGGIMSSIFLVLPPNFWGAAAYHPDRAADATAVMHDLANLVLVTTDQYYMFQLVPIIVIALTGPSQADSPFPRWFGYWTILTMLVFEIGPLGFLFQTGPFTWRGIFVFWFPLSFFGAWLGVMCWSLLRAIGRQQAARSAVA